MTPPWNWVALDSSGETVGTTQQFESRDEAEKWLAHGWESLLEAGAESVRLMDREREVYSMGLLPE